MKTETKISAIAYDVELVDLRTREHVKDRIVLDRSWLDVLNKMDISDRDLIMQTYNKKGYYLLKMETKKKVILTVDLNRLYWYQIGKEVDEEYEADEEYSSVQESAREAQHVANPTSWNRI